jgi:hypothetical protein
MDNHDNRSIFLSIHSRLPARRAIITSVDLMIASASSPRFRRRARTASAVITGSQCVVADAQANLSQQAVDANLLDEAGQLVPGAEAKALDHVGAFAFGRPLGRRLVR